MPRTFTLMLIDLMPAWCIAIKLREKSGGGGQGVVAAPPEMPPFNCAGRPAESKSASKFFSVFRFISAGMQGALQSHPRRQSRAEDGPERNCSISQLVALADSQGFIVNGRDYSITAASTLNRKR